MIKIKKYINQKLKQEIFRLIMLETIKGQRLEIRDLTNVQGLLPIRLGQARTIKGYNNLLHIVKLNNYEENIEKISRSLGILKNTKELHDSFQITQIKLNELKQKLTTLMPRIRNKRGLIDGLGTVIKSITGNMDAEDARRLNKEIDKLLTNQSVMKSDLSKQTSINDAMIKRFENITEHINSQQAIIEEYLNHSHEQTRNKIRAEEDLLKHMQYLNVINYNIDLLNSHLTGLAETLVLARLNIISKQILNLEEISEIFQIFEEQSIKIKSDQHLYELLGLQAYYNNTNIIFNIQIPIFSEENYSLLHIIPIPINNTKKISTKPYIIQNPKNIQYFDERCQRIEGIYLCQESTQQENTNDSECIGRLLQNKPAKCNLIEMTTATEILEPEPNHILLINAPQTEINSSCDYSHQKVKGTVLIHFENCDVKINGITYSTTTSVHWDEIHILPAIFSNITTSSVIEHLTLQKLKSYHIKNKEAIEFLTTRSGKLEHLNIYTYIIIIGIIAAVIAYFIQKYYNSKRQSKQIVEINTTSTGLPDVPSEGSHRTIFLWPSLH